MKNHVTNTPSKSRSSSTGCQWGQVTMADSHWLPPNDMCQQRTLCQAPNRKGYHLGTFQLQRHPASPLLQPIPQAIPYSPPELMRVSVSSGRGRCLQGEGSVVSGLTPVAMPKNIERVCRATVHVLISIQAPRHISCIYTRSIHVTKGSNPTPIFCRCSAT